MHYILNNSFVPPLIINIYNEAYYRLESWYPDIKEFTFDTKVIPLSMDEAMSIKKYKEVMLIIQHEI